MNIQIRTFTLLGLLSVIQGCSSTPTYQERKVMIEDQIWQCKELCSMNTVDIARIEGLKCLCNKQQTQPVINNIIIPGVTQAVPQSNITYSNAVTRNDSEIDTDHAKGYTVKSANNKLITSRSN